MIGTCIIGAGGYTGAELVGLLAAHPEAEILGLFGSEARAVDGAASGAGRSNAFAENFPQFRGQLDLNIEPMSLEAVLAKRPQAVFLATPHEVSHELAPALLKHGIVVIDLSAAFRLRDAAAYQKHYGFEHKYPKLLAEAAYGLPERNAPLIREADLIAAPGCYPTSIILPIAPLVEAKAFVAGAAVIADSTSGVSGAGRSPALKSLFCEVSYQPYGVLSHRHAPEIVQHSGTSVIFTPHLGPFDRGIVSTIHAALAPQWNEEKVRAALQTAYGEEPFVRLLPAGQWPSVAGVRGTNFCDIGLAVEQERQHLIIVSAIDNLLKGAAGQAVQCFNIRFDLSPTIGFARAGLLAPMKEAAYA